MAIIKNYGLRWARSRVDWGRRGKGGEGQLKGTWIENKKDWGEADFKNQIGIYVLYEVNFSPVYIGQAGRGNARLLSRLKQHKSDHLRDRWSHFSWFGFNDVDDNMSLVEESDTSVGSKEALDEIEGVLIHVLEPKLNKQGARWRGSAHEYVQAGLPEQADRISELISKVDKLLNQSERSST